jgi:hypothetical protein
MKLRIGCVLVGFLLFGLSLAAQTSLSSAASAQVPPLIQFSNIATDEGGSTIRASNKTLQTQKPPLERRLGNRVTNAGPVSCLLLAQP